MSTTKLLDGGQRDEELAEKSRGSLWRRVLWSGVIGLLVVAVLAGSYFVFDLARSERVSRDSASELDATDPGWKLEELDESRRQMPDRVNSAIRVKEVVALLGSGWPRQTFYEVGWRVELPELLDAERLKILEAEMVRIEAVRGHARGLADMPTGRNVIEFPANPIQVLLTDQQNARKVANLLQYESLYLANKGDVTGAVRSGRACICAGRSMYDEPFLISALVRIALVTVGCHGVEQALSLGEATEAELIALDRILADEEKHNTFLVGIRGERAANHKLFAGIISGTIPASDLGNEMGAGAGGSWFTRWVVMPRWQFQRQQPKMMEVMNRVVEIARMPAHEQKARLEELEGEVRQMKTSAPLVALLLPATQKVGEACSRKTAMVSCLRVLVAAERYRMKHGRFPSRIENLVPGLLNAVPVDPFDGKPIRMARFAEGVTVYSVGPDGVDDGGFLNRERPATAGSDLGFQLWDPVARRKPARPWEPEKKEP